MITCSERLKKVERHFDPYQDRSAFIRLDRNEDPVGYNEEFFQNWLKSLTVHDIAAYADSTSLVEKLAQWLQVSGENIYISGGSDAVIKNIFECYIDPGQEIIMQNPSWRMYEVYAKIYGAKVHQVPYNEDLNLDFEEFFQKLQSGKIRMAIIANPNQPTGTLIPQNTLYKFLDLAKENNTLVVMDEAYHLFTEQTLAKAIHAYKNLIVVRTFSKAFGMAGLRIGYAIADVERIKDLMLLRPVTDANSLALKFAEYLLDNMPVVMEKISNFIVGRDFLFQQLNQARLISYKSYTNFLLVRCRSMESTHKILREARQRKYLLKGVLTSYPLERCIRITTGSLELMEKFWDECEEIFIKNGAN